MIICCMLFALLSLIIFRYNLPMVGIMLIFKIGLLTPNLESIFLLKKKRMNFLNIPTLFFLIFLNFIHSAEGDGIKECFADMLVLHSPNVGHLSMEMEGKKFVFRKSALSSTGHSDMKKILNHPERLKELWECLEKHNTTETHGKMADKTTLMDIYEKILHNSEDTETFPLSQQFQGKYHNAQCYMDLMVIEGKLKLGSPELIVTKYPIHNGLIRDFLLEKVSSDGAAFLSQCILEDEPLAIVVDSHNYLHLHHRNYHELNGILQKIPHSNELIKNIDPLLVRSFESHHGQLFEKLKQFIYRKVAFLKTDQNNHDDEYVDIEKILSQGKIKVDDEFKGILDKQSDCLVEFLYSKFSVKDFIKIVVKHNDVLYQRRIEYVFNKATEKQFLIIPNTEIISTKLLASGDLSFRFISWKPHNSKEYLGKYIFVDGIDDEFAALKKCGVAIMSLRKDSHNQFDVLRLMDAYETEDLLLPKITNEKIYKVPKTNDIDTKEECENTVPTIVGTDKNTDCSICLKTFVDGEHVESLPCHHFFHRHCINPWMHSHATCPLCRADVVNTQHVIEYNENEHLIRT